METRRITPDVLHDMYIRYANVQKGFSRHELFESTANEDEVDLEEFLFQSTFDKDNYNSGQDLLRYYMVHVWDNKNKSFEFTMGDVRYSLKSDIRFVDDSWFGYVFITDVHDAQNFDLYTIGWYKSRGTTDFIRKNGEDINLGDYLHICNILLQLGCFDDIKGTIFGGDSNE